MRRTVDRVERGVLVSVVLLALLAVPVAVLVGAAVRRSADATAETELASSYQTTALLTRDAQTSDVGVTTAPGTWHTRTGSTETGVVDAPAGAHAGDTVPVWLDRAGHPVDPPLTTDQAYWRGVLTVIVLLIGAFTLLAIGALVAHRLLDRRRFAEWETDWQSVEPHWTHRC